MSFSDLLALQLFFQKFTISLLLVIFLFHVYLTSFGTARPKKPIKTQKTHPGWAFFKNPGFSEPWPTFTKCS